MPEVLLIYPPSYFEDGRSEEELLKNYRVGKTKLGVWPPLGLLYIAAVLREKNIGVEVLDAFVHGLSLSEVMNVITEKKPRIVGIATTTLQVRGAVQLAEKIKERFGHSIFVGAGGPHISIDPEFVKRFKCFDFGIAGEGENTFLRVTQDILAGKKPETMYPSHVPDNLDALPLPARDLINILEYFPSEEPYITLLSARGCPFKCIFCSRVAISDKVRFRDPVKVVDEIEAMMKTYKISTFVFLDDTFTLKRNHTLAICREILNRKLKIKWSCNTRANLTDEELLAEMKRAGCNLILIGVESGDERFRNEVVNKKINDADIARFVASCKKLKLQMGGYFMLGFPGETMKEINKTVGFPVKYDMDLMSIHTTTVYPGSVLHEILEKEGKTDVIGQWDRYARGELAMDDLSLMYIPKDVPLAALQKARKKAYLKFYFRPKIIWRQFVSDVTSFKNLKRDVLIAWQLLRYGRTSKDYK